MTLSPFDLSKTQFDIYLGLEWILGRFFFFFSLDFDSESKNWVTRGDALGCAHRRRYSFHISTNNMQSKSHKARGCAQARGAQDRKSESVFQKYFKLLNLRERGLKVGAGGSD